MGNKTLKISGIIVIVVVAALLIALVLGAVEFEELKTTLGKTVLVVGIAALATIGVTALAGNNKS